MSMVVPVPTCLGEDDMRRDAVVFGLHFAVFEPRWQVSADDVLKLQPFARPTGLQMRPCKARHDPAIERAEG